MMSYTVSTESVSGENSARATLITARQAEIEEEMINKRQNGSIEVATDVAAVETPDHEDGAKAELLKGETPEEKEVDSLHSEVSEVAATAEVEAPTRAEGASPVRRNQEARSHFSDIEKLLLVDVPNRATQASSLLRVHLMGSLKLTIRDTSQKFLFNWKRDNPSMKKLDGQDESADCSIALSKEIFQDIVVGKLNPQIAMLSDKIQVSGKMEHAVYFFNLLVGRER